MLVKLNIGQVKRGLAAAVCAALMPMMVPMTTQAETPVGTWLTPPDAKGVVAHIEARPCGAATCGVIARTYDSRGHPVRTPNLGVRVFWDMVPAGAGLWSGRAFVPAHNRTYASTIQLVGDRLTVRGCYGPVCQSQVWKRVD